ncbi:MAG: MBL fold metallo-hydrolase [Proteobacteria bacterium]|nr:MBL fold metallo-hydrolase [Pseudomonadota bacterium]
MKQGLSLGVFALALLSAQACGAQTAPADLVRDAVTALGGADALRGVKSVVLKGEAKHWEPQQSFVAGREPRLLGDSKITVSWQADKGMARSDWERKMYYPFPSLDKFSEIVTPDFGAVSSPKGDAPMSNIRYAAYLREIERASPLLLLKALDAPQKLAPLPDQMLDGKPLPALAFTDGGVRFTILFDKSSALPAAIRSRDDDPIYGDVDYDLVFADWKSVGALKMAHSHVYRLNNFEVGRVAYGEIAVNKDIPAQAFGVREEGRREAKSPAPGAVPYQWVIRRLNLGRFLDSDAVNYPPSSPGLKLVEVAPNVQHVVGGTHNSLIVARKDHLVVFDAPINEWQSRWTIDAAKAKYPGKPVKYLVLTHHHNDHTGGARTYVAEGASVFVAAPNKTYFEAVFRAPHTVKPDELQNNPKQPNVIEFADGMTLKDDGGDIALYRVDNPHAQGMLVGHLVADNIVWVTDIWSPVRDRARSAGFVAFYDALKKHGLAPERIAGGHGGVVPRAEMEAIFAMK